VPQPLGEGVGVAEIEHPFAVAGHAQRRFAGEDWGKLKKSDTNVKNPN
jgi:hypothetical protein